MKISRSGKTLILTLWMVSTSGSGGCSGPQVEIPPPSTATPVPATPTPGGHTTPTPVPPPTEGATPTPVTGTEPPPPPTQPTGPTPCADVDDDTICASVDCNDLDPNVYPGAPEVCDGQDNNCSGVKDESDLDRDGWHTCAGAPAPGDCDDTNPNISPAASEICDGIDNNCNATTDEGFDQDKDTFATCSVGGIPADCNDKSASVNPNASEVCNNIDDNCNGQTDEGTGRTYYQDQDLDGFGSDSVTVQACSPPAGYVVQGGDCDDTSTSVKPNAQELCDGKDNDCDGTTSDESPLSTFYRDADGDTFGTTTTTTQACAAPAGYVNKSGDCDDTVAATYPNATEICDGKDNDCDAQSDEGLTSTYYHDRDGDSYGDPAALVQSCANCSDCVANDDDCNDGNATIYPGAPEAADGIDNNCDGQAERQVSLSAVKVAYSGTFPGGRMGASVDGIGDMDGDGYDDIAFGAPRSNNNSGGAFIVFGRSSGWTRTTDITADISLTVDHENSELGTSVSGGDINGDTFSDFVVGAPTYDALGWDNAGIVFIIYGGAERLSSFQLTIQDYRATYLAGYTPDVLLGTAVDAHGDINGDYFNDVLIGAPWNWYSQVPPVAGITCMVPGQDGKYPGAGGISSNQLIQIYGETNQILGINVATVGDVDDDGYGDFLAVGKGKQGSITSSYTDGGIAYLIGGDSSAAFPPGVIPPLNAQDMDLATYTGDTGGDLVGKWAAGVGDVNGDGYKDFMLGRQAAKNGEPMGMLYYGGLVPSSGTAESRASVSIKSNAGATCPCSVGSIGDFNGDGLGDFAVASLKSAGGTLFIFYGKAGGFPSNMNAEESANLILTAEASGDEAGAAISSLGDVNGDGHGDFAIGAPGVDSDGRSDAGRVYIMFGF